MLDINHLASELPTDRFHSARKSPAGGTECPDRISLHRIPGTESPVSATGSADTLEDMGKTVTGNSVCPYASAGGHNDDARQTPLARPVPG